MSRIKDDAEKMAKIAESYGGENKAHMIFLANGDKREFQMGGNARDLCAGIVELLVNISAYTVPDDKREDFMVSLIDVVRKMVEDEKKRRVPVQ